MWIDVQPYKLNPGDKYILLNAEADKDGQIIRTF